jgi:hypothetical protein
MVLSIMAPTATNLEPSAEAAVERNGSPPVPLKMFVVQVTPPSEETQTTLSRKFSPKYDVDMCPPAAMSVIPFDDEATEFQNELLAVLAATHVEPKSVDM